MKALLTKSILALALILSSNVALAKPTQCLIDVDVAAWKSIETVLYVAAGGYAFAAPEKAEYKLVIDQVASQAKRCLYGCDQKQDVLMMMSVMNKHGDVIYTDNRVAVQYANTRSRFLTRESNVQNKKIELIRSLPDCEVLKFKN